ncbi:MAG: hypothetical protein E6Q76_10260 [Rhizobium sp.]|nr:MAG: hypothetical protein E6Q76_10260 [Rhizobium sp.]
MSSPYRHGNHFTPFLPASRIPEAVADRLPRLQLRLQRRIEFALLAVAAISLGAAIAGMI